jgi:hypothetical protein
MTPRAGRVTRAIRQDLPLSRSGTRRSRSTRNRYAEVYSVHVAPWLDDVPLGQFGAPQLSGWQAALITAGVSPGTIHKARTLLSSVLGHAAENGAIIGWHAADSAARRVIVSILAYAVCCLRSRETSASTGSPSAARPRRRSSCWTTTASRATGTCGRCGAPTVGAGLPCGRTRSSSAPV